MKQGNQFYLEFQIVDNNGTILTNDNVAKLVFYIGEDIKRTYTPDSTEVLYNEDKKCFEVYLTEAETLEFKMIDIDARILFKNNQILGCEKTQLYFNEVLVKESILDEDTSEEETSESEEE